ncbi:SDR family oxidoreductase [Flagellimonas sp. DF-77]|uniref:SDR family NAD(P)-dependent oxidoreductase n=1 Tax=Flagellimonas algarum TaxID=3230298 RepID=UPI003392BCC0
MKKHILLIGGSHGIGHELIQKLVGEHQITVASRTRPELESEDLTYIPFDATTDVLDPTQLPETIHGFAFLPGSINLKPFKMLSTESFYEAMELNFFAMVKVLKTVLPRMAEGSSMLFFSTVAVTTGMPFHSSIAAAKGAVEGFVKSMAAEYAPKIRFNAIAPSLVDTPLASRLLGNDRKKELMAARHPMKRYGHPEEIAELASFLLRDQSSWVTGQIIGIDGGMSTLNVN